MARILVVDDIAANREILVVLLRHHGHTMFEAADGSEGLAAVRKHHPELVITDVLMPVMDGYEFVRQLRLDPETTSIPVVFYTAHYNEREAKALALASGVAHVLAKPVQSADVLKVVALMLSPESRKRGRVSEAPLAPEFDRQHLRLLTDKLSEKAGDLIATNARLTALMDIGGHLASERDASRRNEFLCASVRELFGATYVNLGLVAADGETVDESVLYGIDATAAIEPGSAVPGIFQRVVNERLTLRGNNHRGNPTNLQLPAEHPPIRAFLAVPVATSSHVFGWICLVGNEGRTFSDDDEHLVEVLASQVGRIFELEYEILERVSAELALRHERDRAQRSLDTAEVILLELDERGCITLANRYACSVLGWTAAELEGRDWFDTCVPERLRVAQRQAFETLALRGELPLSEYLVLTKGGEERLFEWRNTVLRGPSGRPTGTYSSGTDITERTRANEEQRSTEERMRYVLESAGVGIWDVDNATGVLRWSPILEAQCGLEPNSFGGTIDAFAERIHPDDRESVLTTIRKATVTGGDFVVEYRIVRPDGNVRWLSGSGRYILDEEGKAVRGVGISMDVTNRRNLEEQYQQAQKMEAIGRLAGGVAHDFNNLLTVIMGHCEMLLEDVEEGSSVSADVGEIQKAGLSAVGLTRQLLAFSRKQIIQPTDLDLNEVVSDVRGMLGRLIGENITIDVELEENLSCMKADRGQIEQVLMNLAVNARDAMPSGGVLTISTANGVADGVLLHNSSEDGATVMLTVTDTGTGISPQVRSRLFEPFFTTKDVGKGTGLGLATVHGIVTGLGGGVSVRSEVGHGTSFDLYFPAAAPSNVPTVEAHTPRTRGGAETVLVVDDAVSLRDLTRKLLERLGYKVLVAGDANEALALFDSEPTIDVMLTDVVMPGQSGPELTRQLIERRPDLKVIYMSGYTEEAIVHHGVIKPGIAFLHKPFTSATIEAKLREVLGRESAHDSAA